jgi:glucose/arabinose dehydrogenase
MRYFPLVTAMLIAGNSWALPEGFKAETIATGLDAVAVKAAPDGRIFFTEKRGTIRVVRDNKLLSQPFADIGGKTDASREKGLLGLAIDPEFAANKFVYGCYVDKNQSVYIVRWTADGDVAAAGSEKRIFDAGVSGDKNYHHGGDIAFGADGKLYMTRGNREDQGNSKENTSVFGKILRIEKDGGIPADNPRYNENTGNAKAVWAWGLRNSQSLALDGTSGRMFFADIADNTFDDDIHEVKKGAHYGVYGGGNTASLFQKGAGGSALMGGVFYSRKRPSDKLSFPATYHGRYFFGQFEGNGIKFLDTETRKAASFDGAIAGPINFDLAPDGSIWLVTRSTQIFDTKGQLIRIRYPAGETPTVVGKGFPVGAAPGALRAVIGYAGLRRAAAGPGRFAVHAIDGRLLWVGTAESLPAADRFGTGILWVRALP